MCCVGRCDRARQGVDDAKSELHRHGIHERIDGWRNDLVGVERRVSALQTWQQWAMGQPVTNADLSAAASVLTSASAQERALATTIANAMAVRTSGNSGPITVESPALSEGLTVTSPPL